MYGIIYKVTNKVNNKIYIGQTIKGLEERKYFHYYRAENSLEITHTHFINAIRKYGKDNFNWEIIDTADSQEELNQKEIYWIEKFDTINNGYNIQYGGNSYNSDKFALCCGGDYFLAYKVSGEFIGEFCNMSKFGREYNIATSNILKMLKNEYNTCNGIICIKKEEFSQELLEQRIKNAKQSFRPFMAINLKTSEQFGPFTSFKECREKLNLKNNHIGEILKGVRKSQNGYTFKFIDK